MRVPRLLDAWAIGLDLTRLNFRKASLRNECIQKVHGSEKTWVYGELQVCDGKELTHCATSRNSKGYVALLADIEADSFVIAFKELSTSSIQDTTG